MPIDPAPSTHLNKSLKFSDGGKKIKSGRYDEGNFGKAKEKKFLLFRAYTQLIHQNRRGFKRKESPVVVVQHAEGRPPTRHANSPGQTAHATFDNEKTNATISPPPHTSVFNLVQILSFSPFQGYGPDVPKTEWSLLASIPCVMIGLPFMWLLLLDLAAKWADSLSAMIQQVRWNLSRRYPDVVSLQADGPLAPSGGLMGPKVYQNGGSPIVVQNGNGALPYTTAVEVMELDSPLRPAVWTVESQMSPASPLPPLPVPPPTSVIPEVNLTVKKMSPLGSDDHHRAAPWVSTVFAVLYPILGSVVFGLWADLSVAYSFSLPLLSLMLISPPPALESYWWRSLFHAYLMVGWVLLMASGLLWLHSWRNLFKQWTHDLNIKQAHGRAYPIQVR